MNSESICRVAMVTGAAGAVGSAVARTLQHEGWQVAGIDLEKAEADLFLPMDVTDRGAMQAAAARIAHELGPVGLLVTAAADYEKRPFGEMDLPRWRQMLQVWLGGTANACAAVVPPMIAAGGGTVILLSVDPNLAGAGSAYVAAASGTVTAFAKSLACEVGPCGVRVNCLAVQLPANPGRVAHTVRFLASEGQYYAGQVLLIQS